ncbi:hypothetical protein [Streptomyces abikoensis]|uniref:Uncharacterized protein n=1 Tax=Streptomyces abikoensis TaxID=97398 RepID=A0ABW7TCZ9_9ACTN
MADKYETPDDARELFARYKQHYEGERDLKPQMRELAGRELQAGATVGQLAAMTGLTPEVFRRMARDLGVERRRPPTVGKLAARESSKAESKPTRWEGAQATRSVAEPPAGLGLSPAVAALSEDQVRLLSGQAEAQHQDWGREIRRELAGVDPRWMRHAIVEAAVQAGFVDIPGWKDKG